MKLTNWINRKLAILSLAMGNVEKNAFSLTEEAFVTNTTQQQRHTQGTVADDLKQGIITEEVKNLRWRTYKVLQETQGLTAEIVGYDEDGMPIVKTKRVNNTVGLKKIKLEPSDTYPIEMVVDNSEIIISSHEAIDNKHIELLDNPEIIYNDNGEAISATHGEINSTEYFAMNKTEKPIIIERDELVKFNIETYTKKLHIRKINDSKRLLEFYVSMYPDEFNRTTRLFISDIKKAIENPNQSNMLSMKTVDFVSYKTIGVNDFLEFKYNNIEFDKITSYNGHYVIKFIADVELDGVSIFESHRMDTLDKKYENKEKK
jgi:hypothetical protein